jgi:phosphoribosylglycinamide formyltransferase 1
MTRIAIFASGAGSNALRIIEYFRQHETIGIALIVCNKPGAGVLDIAETNSIPVLMIDKERFFRGDGHVTDLHSFNIDFIVLAGFLWKIPVTLTNAFPSSIINIHPALLPAYGGKGMYGMNVHTAIINAREKESGITIHYIDEHYDNGDIIFQERVAIEPTDTPESLANKIHTLEHQHFPKVIEQVIELRKNQ